MRISDRYIGKQVLLGTLYAVFVLGVVLVLGNLFKQIRPLLVDLKAPPELVIRFVINVLPLSLMYTIPWGFLSAVLLVFGKLSGNQEITGFRVAGLSLARLSAPVFVIALLLSLLSLWLNVNVVPESKATVKDLLVRQAFRDPDSLLQPGVVQGDFGNDRGTLMKALIEGKRDGWVEGFHFYTLPKRPTSDSPARTYIHAARAALAIDSTRNELVMKLQDAYAESIGENGSYDVIFAGEAEPVVVPLKDIKQPKTSPKTMSNQEIRQALVSTPGLTDKKALEMRTEIHKRLSFSMACLAFAFVAVPLGLQSRRRENSFGLVISLLIGTGYFLVTMLADEFKSESGALAMLWAPNAVCVLLGLVLFRRARFR